jgi:hypothetical protein
MRRRKLIADAAAERGIVEEAPDQRIADKSRTTEKKNQLD